MALTLSEGHAQGIASDLSPVDSEGTGAPERQNIVAPALGASTVLTAPQTGQETFSAEEIEQIFDENPDLRDAAKQQIARQLGGQIQPDEISDDLLDQQIESNPQLRNAIGQYLQAQGFEAMPGNGNPSRTIKSGTVRQRAYVESNTKRTGCQRIAQCEQSTGNESTDTGDVFTPPQKQPPYPLQSLRDLYTQAPQGSETLSRFGSNFFVSRRVGLLGANVSDAPLDVPVGPDYVVGAGDTLQIDIWGATTQTLSRVVGRDGRVMLPEAGALQVAGLTLGRAETIIATALKEQYRNTQVAVVVSRFHTIRIYVAGDVQRSGGYDVNALATPLSALYAAGGPTAVGSLRTVRHMRGTEQIEEIDLYQFFLHGVHASPVRLESGDTLLVPPAGAQVSVAGAVRRPALYEFNQGNTTLADIIEEAGGLTPAASLNHISIERIDEHSSRETLTVPIAHGATTSDILQVIRKFGVADGDQIFVGSVLPYSERAIYLEGHVTRPGRQPFRDGMRLSDVVHSYGDLLPEPAEQAEIVRLVGPDLHAETIQFNLREALIGNVNPTLQPFDTIRVRGRYDEDAPQVTVRGEVLQPGVYPLSNGMTAAQLVRMAGGVKRDALLERADIASYTVQNGQEVTGKLRAVKIGAVLGGTAPDVDLQAGDILTVHQITGWSEIGEAVTIDGQVKFPGSYGFTEGEHLSSVLRRAGGFRSSAYPAGAVLIRDQVREVETKSREELIRQIETNAASARLAPTLGSGDTGPTLQLIKAQQDEILGDLKDHPPTGRLVVHITADINSWANTSADLELRNGDVLTIPKQPEFVVVAGQVYNATAITYTPNKSAGWYLARAGGASTTANRKEIFIIRANGSVVGRRSGGWFEDDVLSLKLDPGDVVVVPQKIIGSSLVWRNLLTTAQIAASLAITAAVAGL